MQTRAQKAPCAIPKGAKLPLSYAYWPCAAETVSVEHEEHNTCPEALSGRDPMERNLQSDCPPNSTAFTTWLGNMLQARALSRAFSEPNRRAAQKRPVNRNRA